MPFFVFAGVQVEIDFSMRFFQKNGKDIHQAGMTGVSDSQRVFHPLIFCVSKSEDAFFGGKLMDYTDELIKLAGGTMGKCLKDGGSALSAAARSRYLYELACVAHASRGAFQRMGGYHGAKGSLPKYLATHGVQLHDIKIVMSIYFAFENLTTLPDYVTARGLFMDEHRYLPPHVFKHYFPETPQSGAAAHDPTEVGSTQGLEKTWDIVRKKQKEVLRVSLQSSYFAFFEAVSSRERTVKPFCTQVSHTIADWAHIQRFSSNTIGEEFLYATYYDANSGELTNRGRAVGHAQSKPYVVYLPMPHFMNEIFETEKRRADELVQGPTVGFLADRRTVLDSTKSTDSIMQSCLSVQVACISSMNRYLEGMCIV